MKTNSLEHLRTMLGTRESCQTRVCFISTFSPSRRAIFLQLNAVSNNNTSTLVVLYRERLTIANQMIPVPHCLKPANRLSGSPSIVLCIVHMSPIQVTMGPETRHVHTLLCMLTPAPGRGLGGGYIIHALLNDRNTTPSWKTKPLSNFHPSAGSHLHPVGRQKKKCLTTKETREPLALALSLLHLLRQKIQARKSPRSSRN